MSGKQVVPGLPFIYSEKVAVHNLGGEAAVMQTQLDGTTVVPITNKGDHPMTFMENDVLGYAHPEPALMAPEDMGAKERAQCNPEQLEALECYLQAQQAWRAALEENVKNGEMCHLPKARPNTSDGEVDNLVEDNDDPYEGGSKRIKSQASEKHQKQKENKERNQSDNTG